MLSRNTPDVSVPGPGSLGVFLILPRAMVTRSSLSFIAKNRRKSALFLDCYATCCVIRVSEYKIPPGTIPIVSAVSGVRSSRFIISCSPKSIIILISPTLGADYKNGMICFVFCTELN